MYRKSSTDCFVVSAAKVFTAIAFQSEMTAASSDDETAGLVAATEVPAVRTTRRAATPAADHLGSDRNLDGITPYRLMAITPCGHFGRGAVRGQLLQRRNAPGGHSRRTPYHPAK